MALNITKKVVLQDLNKQLKLSEDRLKALNSTTASASATTHVPLPASKRTPARRGKGTGGTTRIPMSQSKKVYDANYKWNMGGRLKELRIRCIARKFLNIWIKNVYGRVRIAKAREFHNLKVKRQVFSVWYELYWTERKETRLMIRAQCHERLTLWSKTFLAWQRYTVSRRARNAVLNLADKHHQVRLQRTVLAHWHEFAQSRLQVALLKHKAYLFHGKFLLRHYWDSWLTKLKHKHVDRDKNTTALLFWARQTQWKAFQGWREGLLISKYQKERLQKASNFYNSKLSRTIFTSWREYILHRQMRNVEKNEADQTCDFYLKKRCFTNWKLRFLRQRQLESFMQRVNDMSVLSRLRRAFEAWKTLILVQRRKEDLKINAERFYEMSIKRKVLVAMHSYLSFRRDKTMLVVKAIDYNAKRQIKFVWNRWLLRCEQNEEIKMLPLSRKARKLHTKHLCLGAFKTWKQYVTFKMESKTKNQKAADFFKSKAYPLVLNAWLSYVQIRRNKKLLREKSDEVFRLNTCEAVMSLWKSRMELFQEEKYLQRVAVLHDIRRMQQNTLAFWLSRTKDRLTERHKLFKAEEYFKSSLLKKVFGGWSDYSFERSQIYKLESKAALYYQEQVLNRIFCSWKSFSDSRKLKKQKFNIAVNHWKLSKTQRHFQAWRSLVDSMKLRRTLAEGRGQAHDKLVLIKVWHLFKLQVQEQKVNRLNKHLALRSFYHSTISKTFRAWRAYTTRHSISRTRTKLQVQSAVAKVRPLLLRRWFEAWVSRRDSLVLMRFKEARADLHFERVVVTKCLETWKKLVHIQQTNILLRNQADIFRSVSLVRCSFGLWKHSTAAKVKENTLNVKAMCFWALNLQDKCFYAWLVYTKRATFEKERGLAALNRYRSRLLRGGVNKWLSVSLSLEGMRSVIAETEEAEVARFRFRCAMKAALHWRQWARLRARKTPVSRNPSVEHVNNSSISTPVSQQHVRPSSPRSAFLPVSKRRPAPKIPEFLYDSHTKDREIEQTPFLPEILTDKSVNSDVQYQSVAVESVDLKKDRRVILYEADDDEDDNVLLRPGDLAPVTPASASPSLPEEPEPEPAHQDPQVTAAYESELQLLHRQISAVNARLASLTTEEQDSSSWKFRLKQTAEVERSDLVSRARQLLQLLNL